MSTSPTSGVWLASAAAPGLALCPGASVLGREQLLDGLAQALGFPDYFGRNWDAAWDCLTELQWPDAQPICLQLLIADDCQVDEQALEQLIEVMQEAAEHWQARDQELILLIRSSQDLPCLQALPQWPPLEA
jgi:RNAse (barnase) inhibitor barstar